MTRSPGLSEEWLPSADSPVALERTPTRFGAVDLRLTADEDADEYALMVARESGNREPEEVIVHLPGEPASDAEWLVEREDGAYAVSGGRSEFSVRIAR